MPEIFDFDDHTRYKIIQEVISATLEASHNKRVTNLKYTYSGNLKKTRRQNPFFNLGSGYIRHIYAPFGSFLGFGHKINIHDKNPKKADRNAILLAAILSDISPKSYKLLKNLKQITLTDYPYGWNDGYLFPISFEGDRLHIHSYLNEYYCKISLDDHFGEIKNTIYGFLINYCRKHFEYKIKTDAQFDIGSTEVELKNPTEEYLINDIKKLNLDEKKYEKIKAKIIEEIKPSFHRSFRPFEMLGFMYFDYPEILEKELPIYYKIMQRLTDKKDMSLYYSIVYDLKDKAENAKKIKGTSGTILSQAETQKLEKEERARREAVRERIRKAEENEKYLADCKASWEYAVKSNNFPGLHSGAPLNLYGRPVWNNSDFISYKIWCELNGFDINGQRLR